MCVRGLTIPLLCPFSDLSVHGIAKTLCFLFISKVEAHHEFLREREKEKGGGGKAGKKGGREGGRGGRKWETHFYLYHGVFLPTLKPHHFVKDELRGQPLSQHGGHSHTHTLPNSC